MPPTFKQLSGSARSVPRDDISTQDGSQHYVRRKLENASSIHGENRHSAAAHKVAYTQPVTNEHPTSYQLECTRKHGEKSLGVITRRVPTMHYTGQSQHCNSGKLSNPGGSARNNYSFVVSTNASKVLIEDGGCEGPRMREVKPKQCVERQCYQPRY